MSKGCMVFFTVIVLLVAAIFTIPIIVAIVGWNHVRNWNHVPAAVESVSLKDEGLSTTRPRTRHYTLEIAYSYNVSGKEYTEHASYSYMPASLASEKYRALLRKKNENGTISCYVNPQVPEQAILYQAEDAQFYLKKGITVLLLILIAFAPQIISLAWKNLPDATSASQGRAMIKEIHSSYATPSLNVIVSLAAVWFLVVVILSVLLKNDSLVGEILLIAVVVIPLIVVAFRISESLIYRATLKLESLPAAPGENVVGTIRTWIPFPENASVRLEIRCRAFVITHVTSGAERSNEVSEIEVYDQNTMANPVSRRTTEISFSKKTSTLFLLFSRATQSVRIKALRRLFTQDSSGQDGSILFHEDSQKSVPAVTEEMLRAAAAGQIISEIPVDVVIEEPQPYSGAGNVTNFRWTLEVHSALSGDKFKPAFPLPITWPSNN